MWGLIILFVVGCWLWGAITAPARAAKSLKNIEQELKRRR